MSSITRLGNGQSKDPEAVAKAFVARFSAAPSTVSHDEVVAQYRSVEPLLTPASHAEAAQEAFAQLSPTERLALGKYLISQAQAQGFPPLHRDFRM